MASALHFKCTIGSYPRADQVIRRVSEVDWNIIDQSYAPIDYTAPCILKQPSFADQLPSSQEFAPAWNSLDGAVDRRSHKDLYPVVDGLPRNPHGRTGVTGRGLLGHWGPNHAADPVVTRWKRGPSGTKVLHASNGRPVLQFVSTLRGDGGGWALPGGMVDPGEVVSHTLKREFMEEAMNSNDMTDEQKQAVGRKLQDLFIKGVDVYRGYVDDPRNTDNAWMETVAQNFHQDEPGGVLDQLQLHAGDDATAVRWQDVSAELQLYASHTDILRSTAELRDAFWE